MSIRAHNRSAANRNLSELGLSLFPIVRRIHVAEHFFAEARVAQLVLVNRSRLNFREQRHTIILFRSLRTIRRQNDSFSLHSTHRMPPSEYTLNTHSRYNN